MVLDKLLLLTYTLGKAMLVMQQQNNHSQLEIFARHTQDDRRASHDESRLDGV
jgi:hypothetical protein